MNKEKNRKFDLKEFKKFGAFWGGRKGKTTHENQSQSLETSIQLNASTDRFQINMKEEKNDYEQTQEKIYNEMNELSKKAFD